MADGTTVRLMTLIESSLDTEHQFKRKQRPLGEEFVVIEGCPESRTNGSGTL